MAIDESRQNVLMADEFAEVPFGKPQDATQLSVRSDRAACAR
jgi:hypothetical protein